MNHHLEHFDRCPQCDLDLRALRLSLCRQPLAHCPSCCLPLTLVAAKYRLERRLAEGGFGVLYLARHIHLKVDAHRVIKFLKADAFARPEHRQRFLQEIQITASLTRSNEHIVRIYDDFGEIPQLGHFYVMEYLDGQTLASWLCSLADPPEVSECLLLFSQLCQAIHAAHLAGIVHRDLKPDNVVLVPRPSTPPLVKVLDFGIACALYQSHNTSSAPDLLQRTQGLLGSPLYCSPEQFRNGVIDERADIYSLGVILYELLAGRTPFAASLSSSHSHALGTLCQAHLHETPPSPHTLRPDRVTPAMERVLLRALAKQPQARFSSVAQMHTAVVEAHPGLSLRVTPTTPLPQPYLSPTPLPRSTPPQPLVATHDAAYSGALVPKSAAFFTRSAPVPRARLASGRFGSLLLFAVLGLVGGLLLFQPKGFPWSLVQRLRSPQHPAPTSSSRRGNRRFALSTLAHSMASTHPRKTPIKRQSPRTRGQAIASRRQAGVRHRSPRRRKKRARPPHTKKRRTGPSQTPGCPADHADLRWVRLNLKTTRVHVVLDPQRRLPSQRRGLVLQRATHLCLGLFGPTEVAFFAPGYTNCTGQITLRRRVYDLQLKQMKTVNEFDDTNYAYCLQQRT